MKYIIKTKLGYYKFCRKIPHTKKQFIFSLKTKNAKISKKIVNKFLIKSNHYFLHLQNLEQVEVMSKISEIQSILEEYRLEALKEYSKLEEDRHNHFKYKDTDGSHPEALKHWTQELHGFVANRKTIKQSQELTRQILKRSTLPLKHYYSSLDSPEDKRIFTQLLIKTEVRILKEDYKRAKEYFDLDHQLNNDNTKQLEESIINTISEKIGVINPIEIAEQLNIQEKAKYLTKTKYEIFEEYKDDKIQNGTYVNDKIGSPILTFFQSSKEEYLIDYTKDDYDLFFDSLLYTPSLITGKKRIFSEYDENFVAIAEDFKNDDLEEYGYKLGFQSVTNLKEKLGNINTFLRNCITNGYLDKNILLDNIRYSTKRFNNIAKSAQEREPYSTSELIKMLDLMTTKDFYTDKKILYFYLPLIALFSGLRLEEIAKLKVLDVKKEDSVYYFDINGHVKTPHSTRIVPIHKYLIDKFKFLDYLRTRESEIMLFDFKHIKIGNKTKFSHYYSRDFTNFRNTFVSEDRIIRDLISFHSFRHTLATRLGEAEVEFVIISTILGHKPSTSETPRYTKYSLARKNKIINKMYIKDIEPSLNTLSLYFKKYITV